MFEQQRRYQLFVEIASTNKVLIISPICKCKVEHLAFAHLAFALIKNFMSMHFCISNLRFYNIFFGFAQENELTKKSQNQYGLIYNRSVLLRHRDDLVDLKLAFLHNNIKILFKIA